MIKCKGWTWDSWKCRGGAIVLDAIDVVAVVPFWGKIADTAQLGKIVYKLAKSGGSKEVVWLLKNGREILENAAFKDKRGYWAIPPLGHYGRGIRIEKALHTSQYSGWGRLDDVTKNTPLIDFARRVGNRIDVISVKSHDLSGIGSSNSSRLTSDIVREYTKLQDRSETGLKKILESRGVDVPANTMYTRQLDVVIDRTPTDDALTGLKKAVCRRVLSNSAGIPALKVWVNTGTPADGFVEWTVSEPVCRAITPPIQPFR